MAQLHSASGGSSDQYKKKSRWWSSCLKQNEFEESEASTSQSAPQNDDQEDIASLYIDCVKESYEYLPLTKLVALSERSNLQQQIGQYFQRQFLAKVLVKSGIMYTENSRIEINCFSEFVRSISVTDGDLQFFCSKRFESLKAIEFIGGELRSLDSLREILPNVKTLKFSACKLNGDIHKIFLRNCEKLKRLHVTDTGSNEFFVGTSNDWLTKQYLSLQHFELNSRRENDQVIKFLAINPYIHRFSTTIEFLIGNMGSLLKNKIKLSVLSILHENTNISDREFNDFMSSLWKMKTRKNFFSELHLHVGQTTRKYTYSKVFQPFITLLDFTNNMQTFTSYPLLNLEQLYLFDASQIDDLDAPQWNLPKLNYIHITFESIEHLLPFIRRLPRLEAIKIDRIKVGRYFVPTTDVIDLEAINHERMQLDDAEKLTIFVKEPVYLATKSTFQQVELMFVEVKRIESKID